MNKKPQSITFQRAAAELCVSASTVKRLIRRGTLHTTKPELVDGHWARRIFWDKAFLAERARRLNGLKAPRRKRIPAAIDPHDPSPIQTVTPKQKSELAQAAMLERAENAMNICLEAQKDCIESRKVCAEAVLKCLEKDYNVGEMHRRCKGLEESISQSHTMTERWVNKWLLRLGCSEGVYTRCTAILAAACILQLLLAAYYTLCHFNII